MPVSSTLPRIGVLLPPTPRRLRSRIVHFADGNPSGSQLEGTSSNDNQVSETSSDESDKFGDQFGLDPDDSQFSDNSETGGDEIDESDDEYEDDVEPDIQPERTRAPNSKKCEWSQETRVRIVAWSEAGWSQYKIAREL